MLGDDPAQAFCRELRIVKRPGPDRDAWCILTTTLAAAGPHINFGIEPERPEFGVECALQRGTPICRAVRPGTQIQPIAFYWFHSVYCTTPVC